MINGYLDGYWRKVKLTSLKGQDENALMDIIRTYRRLEDVPDYLITTILEYRGYTGVLFVFCPVGPRVVKSKTGSIRLVY